MNIFEGGRRILLATMGLAVFIGLWTLWADEPYAAVKINVRAGPITELTEDGCDYSDATEYKTVKDDSDQEVNIQFCFKAEEFPSGLLIPYKYEKDQYWGDEKYSQQVMNYTKSFANSYTYSGIIVEAINDAYSDARFDQIVETFKMLGAFLLGIFAFATFVGWVLRGFMGIPSGLDKKPQ